MSKIMLNRNLMVCLLFSAFTIVGVSPVVPAQGFEDVPSVQASPVQASPVQETPARHPSEVFPVSTLVYAELMPPGKLIQTILNHPIRGKVESLPQVKQAMRSKGFVGFLAGLGVVQVFAGMDWEESLQVLAGKGIAFGFSPEQNAFGAVLLSADKKRLLPLCKGLLRFANQADSNTVQSGKHRDIEAYSIAKQFFIVPLEDRVFVSNTKKFAMQMVDFWLDDDQASLQLQSQFQKAVATRGDDAIWTYVDLKSIRDGGIANGLFPEKMENIGLEAIAGGVLEALKKSDFLTGALTIGESGLKLSLVTPFQNKAISESRKYFFGSAAERQNFQLLQLPGLLANIHSFRDLGQLWISKEDLFDENHLSEISQADSTLSTLFSGLDFGEEILGSTKPGFQIMARNQDYSKILTPIPEIKIPEFAVVLQLKETGKIQRRFKIAYQSFIGFLNIQLAMQGAPQFELESEKLDGSQIVSATYLVDDDNEEGILNYNFSPSVAFAGNWFIISSTRVLATDLAKTGMTGAAVSLPEINTSFQLQGAQLAKILSDNQEQLIAQNMLEEGTDREDAKTQVGLILDVVALFKKASLMLKQEPGSLRLQLAIDVQGNDDDSQ
jgi:hypothetical protein